MAVVLEIAELNVLFDTGIERVKALKNVSVTINNSEIVGIVGASGSGKSTLAKTVLGLEAPTQSTSGQILYRKDDLRAYSKAEWINFRKNQATMVFQNSLLNLNPSLRILKHFERINSSNSEKIYQVLQDVGLGVEQDQILNAYPHQLSGGQQQRVLLALAFYQEVELLFLDEPISSLDQQNADLIIDILKSAVDQRGISVLVISHDIDVIQRLTDRVYVLNNGEIIEEGISNDVITVPKTDYTRALVEARRLNFDKSIPNDNPIIKIDGVSHVYNQGGFLSWKSKKTKALNSVSVQIPEGSIVGIVGPSGSGKSTLIKLMLGAERLQSGTLTIDGIDLSRVDAHSRMEVSKLIQMIPQNTEDALNPKLLLRNQLLEVYNAHYDLNQFDQVIASILTDLNLDVSLLKRYPQELSGGEIQRMAIARALIVRPKILVLDESISALDMLVQKQILSLIVDLNRKLSMTILLISHDNRIIKHCCHQVIQLEEGNLKG